MKIKTKLQLVAILPVLVFIVAMAGQFSVSAQIGGVNAKDAIINAMAEDISGLITLTYEYGITRGERARIQWVAQHGRLESHLRQVAAVVETPDEKKILDEVRRGHAFAGRRFSELVDFDAGGQTTEKSYGVRTNMVNSLVLEMGELAPGVEKLHVMTLARLSRLGRYANIMFGVLGFLLALVIPPVLFFTVKRITLPIDRLQEGMKIIASGDLRHRLPEQHSQDEISLLSRGFNDMARRIETVTVSRDELLTQIDERRRAEAALSASELRLKEAQRLAHVGSWDLDLTTNALAWSDEIYRIFEIDPNVFGATYEAFLNAIHPDDRDAVNQAYTDSLRSKGNYEIDHRLLMKDGRIKHVHEQCETLYDTDGAPIRSMGTVQDITDRKKLEDELRFATSYERSLIESSLDPLVTIGPDGKITDVNSATERACGYSREQLIGTDFSDYFTDPERARAVYRQVFREEQVRDYALEIRHQDGHTIPVLYNASLYRDDTGRVVGIFAAARDISDLKKAEDAIRSLNEDLERRVADRTAKLEGKSAELSQSQMALMNIVEDLNEKTAELEQANSKLKELDQLKSMFIASMSHELRTPLNSIIGFSSIMLNEWTGPLTTEQKENLATVLRSGKHLLSLINDVIDVSKIETGKIESIPEKFDIHDLVIEAAETLRKEIENKGLALHVQASRQEVFADRRRLLQCLLNLLSNAMKYTKQGEIHVSVELAADGETMTIAVEDTGSGIREEDRDKLFLPFVRLHRPMESIVPGTGLGLYLTNKLTQEILKGTILVDSTYGTGSRFSLRIPLSV